jgi:FAD/FMN-containing dehydrogenase
MIAAQALCSWARQHGISIEDPPSEAASIDFGRWKVAVPSSVVRPETAAQLCLCIRFLAQHQQPYVFRGAAHSSGGQTLLTGGVVIDLGRLQRVLHDDPDREQITVEGGMTWRALLDHLAQQGRRPVGLTSCFDATIAGTVAVGGFCDTTHLYGLLTAAVLSIDLVTPDGSLHHVGPGEPLFEYSLAGRGQLGAIAAVTLRTLRRPLGLTIRSVTWPSLSDLLRDSLVVSQLGLYEFLRCRLFYREDAWRGQAMFGHFSESAQAAAPAVEIDALRPDSLSELGQVHLHEHLHEETPPTWPYACPAVEVALPLPDGLRIWERLAQHMHEHGLVPYLDHGIAVMLVPRQSAVLAPLPNADYSFLLAIRPRILPAEVGRYLRSMRQLAQLAVEAGGSLYLMSVEPSHELLRRQFGDRWSRWQALKQAVDPHGLCCPGLLQ